MSTETKNGIPNSTFTDRVFAGMIAKDEEMPTIEQLVLVAQQRNIEIPSGDALRVLYELIKNGYTISHNYYKKRDTHFNYTPITESINEGTCTVGSVFWEPGYDTTTEWHEHQIGKNAEVQHTGMGYIDDGTGSEYGRNPEIIPRIFGNHIRSLKIEIV